MGKEKKKRKEDSSESEDSDEEKSEDRDSDGSSSSSSAASKKRRREKKKRKKEKKKKRRKSESLSHPKISKSDYYVKNAEFRLWLKTNSKIGRTFDKMETTEAKKHFAKFVKKWNRGSLGKEIYGGGGGGEKSDFRWGFAEGLDAGTRKEIDAVKRSNSMNEANVSRQNEAGTSNKVDRPSGPRMIGPMIPDSIAQALQNDDSGPDEQEIFERAMNEKRFKDYVKSAEEDLNPKPSTAFEARMEKRAKRRLRDTSPGLSDKVLLGDSSNMGVAIEKRKQRREAKIEVTTSLAKEKLAAYAEKEKAKMEALLEMARSSKKDGALWQ